MIVYIGDNVDSGFKIRVLGIGLSVQGGQDP